VVKGGELEKRHPNEGWKKEGNGQGVWGGKNKKKPGGREKSFTKTLQFGSRFIQVYTANL